jgi:hypothetical protein
LSKLKIPAAIKSSPKTIIVKFAVVPDSQLGPVVVAGVAAGVVVAAVPEGVASGDKGERGIIYRLYASGGTPMAMGEILL